MATSGSDLRGTPEEILRILDEQNPWHHGSKVPNVLAPPTERPLAQHLWRRVMSAAPRRFLIILGARRVGKTTVMYQTVRHLLGDGVPATRLWWMRLDHPVLLREDLGALVRLVVERSGATAEDPVNLLLDEVVYARDWDLWLKTMYDEHWPVRIVATSSATAALRDRRLESGIGRWSDLYLPPYGFAEFLDLLGRHPALPLGDTLHDTLRGLPPGVPSLSGLDGMRRRFTLVGGFPELLDYERTARDDDDAARLLRSQQVLRTDAVERAVYKDIPQSYGLDDPMRLERLLYVLAAQFTGLISPTKIGGELELPQPTLDRYLSFLERAYLVFTLPGWASSEESRQRRGRKLYFVDGAVRNAALQRGIAPLNDSAELGKLDENLVAATLHSYAQLTSNRLFHWRDGGREVDLILEDDEHPLAIEVAGRTRHTHQGLQHLIGRYPRFHGNAYLVSPDAAVRHPDQATGIGTLPLDTFVLAVGRHAENALEAALA